MLGGVTSLVRRFNQRTPKAETQESRVELTPGGIYRFPNGLPRFPEVETCEIHHTERVAGADVVWFTSDTHSLDYAIVTEPNKLESSLVQDPEPAPDFRELRLNLLRRSNKASIYLSVREYDDREQKDMAALLKAVESTQVLRAPLLVSGKEKKPVDTSTRNEVEWAATTDSTLRQNYTYTAAISLAKDLLALDLDPETKSLITRTLRIMIQREKKIQRTAEIIPEELTYPALVKQPEKTRDLLKLVAKYSHSAHHMIKEDLASTFQHFLKIEEKDPKSIICLESLCGNKEQSPVHQNNLSLEEREAYALAVQQNLGLYRMQTNEKISSSDTFQNPRFGHTLFNNPEINASGRLNQQTTAFGSTIVSIQGEKVNEDRPPYATNPSDLEGVLFDTRVKIFMTTPQKRYTTKRAYEAPIPYAFELLCPKTKTAKEVKEFLLNHPTSKVQAFFRMIDSQGKIIVSGKHFLRVQGTQALDKKAAAQEMHNFDDITKTLYNMYMNPIQVLHLLGLLDPDSASQPDFYKEFMLPQTFAAHHTTRVSPVL